jgi:uncharacterized protein (TIGR02145 family)
LGALQVAASSNDQNAYGDLYQWGRGNDAHQCRTSLTTNTLSSVDQPGNFSFISVQPGSYWRSPPNHNLWQGVNGVNNPCPSGYRIPTEAELNAERLSWSQDNIAGAFASPLKWTRAGYRTPSSLTQVGAEGVYWSSTVIGFSTKSLYIQSGNSLIDPGSFQSFGHSVRCIKEITGAIGAINCGSTTQTGTLTSSTAASNVSISIPYTGGNGGSFVAQSISSTGIVGLTASLSAGNFAVGSGSLTYTIIGTPTTSGTATFAISVGGQSCSLTVSVLASNPWPQYPAGSVFCTGTVVVDVTNPTTGRIWMDRNLGATQAATSSTDANAYGDFYQWGRRSDGHQCRTSSTSTDLSSLDQPANGYFIITQSGSDDWRSPQNANLWQGVNGVNNPCPSGYRLPTETELNAERLSWSQNNGTGAFASPLKWTLAGYRSPSGQLNAVSLEGAYWSSTVISNGSRYCYFDIGFASFYGRERATGYSVRCIKN